jgi:hypothetical protein
VNYGPGRAQAYVSLAGVSLGAPSVCLRDLMHPRIAYERSAAELTQRGLYLDVPAWRAHVFEVVPQAPAS